MSPVALMLMLPGVAPVCGLPMRTPDPATPEFKITLPCAWMTTMFSNGGAPTAAVEPMPTPLPATDPPVSTRSPPTLSVTFVAVAPAPPRPPMRTPARLPPEALPVSVTSPVVVMTWFAPWIAATLLLPPSIEFASVIERA
jgi:hypothetical protein